MASSSPPTVPLGSEVPGGAALQHWPWRKLSDLSSSLAKIERFLDAARFERAPWLVVGFAAGIALWFALANTWQWLALIALCLGGGAAVIALLRDDGRYPFLRLAVAAMLGMAAAGCGVVWAKSALVGAAPIERPMVAPIEASVVAREEQPAQGRVRLVLAMREPGSGRAIRVRVNLPAAQDRAGIVEGARLKLQARLMPPAAPMLPGGYDFARAAWFSGISATGSVQGKVEVLSAPVGKKLLPELKRAISAHVRERLPGSPGAIAAAFASGDRGGIALADEEAMRDAGLTHLLSISGLHVSAVIAAVWLLALRLFALWPWLALRVRLPLLAAGTAALAGIAYTLLTGAEVPTVRSCIGALLVLAALAIGREPLSMRMVAVAALLVLLAWPEALVGPSFQMSFAAVIAIVALHGAKPLRDFLAPREEPWWARGGRRLAMLLLTGLVIEAALMPIGLFHFHRAGVYGALANVIAIPLTTFVSMPAIALALLFDSIGAGAPFWWVAGKSLELLLALAHWTAAQPGAVTAFPAIGAGQVLLFVGGGLWLALWRGKVRLLGLAPALLGTVLLLTLRPPDLLISGDGRHVGITGEAGTDLLVLRDSRSQFTRENLLEIAGMEGDLRALDTWPGAQCNTDFCALRLRRGGRDWQLLLGRGREYVAERALAAACDRADVVIADRWLPASCRPRWLKADRNMLARSGGMAIDLARGKVRTVEQGQGEHGWWRVPEQALPRMAPRASDDRPESSSRPSPE